MYCAPEIWTRLPTEQLEPHAKPAADSPNTGSLKVTPIVCAAMFVRPDGTFEKDDTNGGVMSKTTAVEVCATIGLPATSVRPPATTENAIEPSATNWIDTCVEVIGWLVL